MFSAYKLSEGALEIIMNGGTVSEPIMQILGTKKMLAHNTSGSERIRFLLSDGKHKINTAMFGLQGYDPNRANDLNEFAVIKLKRFHSSVIQSKDKRDTRILLILELEIVAKSDQIGHMIGNPIILPGCESQNSQSVNCYGDRKTERVNQTLHSKIISPISSLSPFHNNWTVRARVVNKTNIRNWSNARGEGKLFSADLIDQSGEIRCTAFKELADKFFNRIEVDKIYFISKCQLKPINRKFCLLKHNFEMTLTPESTVEESLEGNSVIPKISYNFITIDKIAVMQAGTVVDVIGICKEISELQIFTAKSSNREMKKKQLLLIDQTKTAISLTLWGSQAESFVVTGTPVLLVKNAKIYEFMSSKSITLAAGSFFKLNPDIPETHKLQNWYQLEGKNAEINNVSLRNGLDGQLPLMSFKEVQRQNLTDKALYYKTCGTILLLRLDRAVYKSCPSVDCQKKVINLENGMYRCDKCNREFPNFKYRLLVSMNVSDSSSSQWATVFSSEAEKLLGKTGQEIGELMETDPDTVANIFEDVHFKQFIFKCRAKVETYNDEQRVKHIIVGIAPMDYEEYNAYLTEKIEKISGVLHN